MDEPDPRELEPAAPPPPPPHDAARRELQPRPVVVGPDTPVVTYVLVALNVAWFGWMLMQGVDAMHPGVEDGLRFGSNHGPAIAAGQWWRLLSAAFVHYGVTHLAFNMWALWVLGPMSERLFGRSGFVALYLLGALGCSALSVLVHPGIFSAGASGAIFALIGGNTVFLWLHRREMPAALKSLRSRMLTMLIANLAFGFLMPQIDNFGHLGGLIAGVAAAWCLDRDPQRWPSWTARRASAAGFLALFLIGACLFIPARVKHSGGALHSADLALAEEALARNDVLEVIRRASAVLEKDAENVDALELRATAHARLDHTAQALADSDAILRLQPGNAQASIVRGLLRFDRGDFAGAAADLARVARSERANAPIHALLGKACLAQGHWADAKSAFHAATKRARSAREDDDGAPAWLWLARTLAGEGEDATRELRQTMTDMRSADLSDWDTRMGAVALGRSAGDLGPGTSQEHVREHRGGVLLFDAARSAARGDATRAREALDGIRALETEPWIVATANAVREQLAH